MINFWMMANNLREKGNFFYKTLNVNMSITRSEINIRAFNNVEKLNKFENHKVYKFDCSKKKSAATYIIFVLFLMTHFLLLRL